MRAASRADTRSMATPRCNDAFTLIELLMVVLVVALLLAIAAPTFLGQQRKAQDSAAKQYLAYAWKAARDELASSDSAPSAATVSGARKVSPPAGAALLARSISGARA